MLKIYLAQAMTGLDTSEVHYKAIQSINAFHCFGIKVISPVIEEGIQPNTGNIDAGVKLKYYWKRDKELIQQCFCVVDLDADRKSEGVAHEVLYERYCLWRPIIRISPRHYTGYFSVASLEDDIIVRNIEEAAQKINELWGNWWKRRKWQWKMYNRCLLKWIWLHIKGLIL